MAATGYAAQGARSTSRVGPRRARAKKRTPAATTTAGVFDGDVAPGASRGARALLGGAENFEGAREQERGLPVGTGLAEDLDLPRADLRRRDLAARRERQGAARLESTGVEHARAVVRPAEDVLAGVVEPIGAKVQVQRPDVRGVARGILERSVLLGGEHRGDARGLHR